MIRARTRVARPSREAVDPGAASFAVSRYTGTTFPFNWHFHPEMEFAWVEKGRGIRIVGDCVEPFGDGDLALLGPELPHSWQSTGAFGESASLVVQFLPDVLDGLPPLPELAAVAKAVADASRGLLLTGGTGAAVRELLDAMHQAAPGSTRRYALLLDALATVGQSDPEQARPLASSAAREPPDARLGRVLDLVHRTAHTGDLTQAHAADLANLSPAAFSRFFRRRMGRTFVHYVNEWRTGLASRRLAETDEPVLNVAFDSGFESLSNFNRRFRQLKGMTPTEYRSKYRGG